MSEEKPLLQIEHELLMSGEVTSEDELSKLYPHVIGNGHISACLCPICAPDEYAYSNDNFLERDSREDYGLYTY